MSSFAPANISRIFKIKNGSTPETTGSYGLGITLKEGVNVSIESSEKAEVFYNNKKVNFPTVERVIDILLYSSSDGELAEPESRSLSTLSSRQKSSRLRSNNINIFINSPFPLGCGFGMSGASALATAYEINKVFRLEKSDLELAKIAHVAEVENGTGLGDVVNQYYGGCLMKTKPSFLFEATRIQLDKQKIYYKIIGSLSTKSIIKDEVFMKRLDGIATKCLDEVESRFITLENLLMLSKQFCKQSGFLKDEQIIKEIKNIESLGGHASMILVGNAVMSDIPFESSSEAEIGTILH